MRAGWVLIAISVMASAVAVCGKVPDPMLRSECSFGWSVVLAALGFPLTVAWWIGLSGIGAALAAVGIEVGGTAAFEAVGSIGLLLVGYIQWFIIAPRLLRRGRERTNS